MDSPAKLLGRARWIHKHGYWLKYYSVEQIASGIGSLADRWLDPRNYYRRTAVARLHEATGYSASDIESAVVHTFEQLRAPVLSRLIRAELGSPQVLDGFVRRAGGRVHATGPDLTVVLAAGNIPGPAVLSASHALLVKSPVFVKTSSEEAVLLPLFVKSMKQHVLWLGRMLHVGHWAGGDEAIERELFAMADLVVAYGSDATIESVRRHLPAKTRLFAYGHRLSFVVIGSEALYRDAPSVIRAAAMEVTAFDQQGCLSPHVLYVAQTRGYPAERFAETLAAELAKIEAMSPRRALSLEEHAAIQQIRARYEFKPGCRVWASSGSTAWTVIFDRDPTFTPSCLNRVVFVKPFRNFWRLTRRLREFGPRLQTVALALEGNSFTEAVQLLADCGVNRVCRLGEMQRPSALWPHDGRPNLGDFVRFTFIED